MSKIHDSHITRRAIDKEKIRKSVKEIYITKYIYAKVDIPCVYIYNIYIYIIYTELFFIG